MQRIFLILAVILSSTCIAFTQNTPITTSSKLLQSWRLYHGKEIDDAKALVKQVIARYPNNPDARLFLSFMKTMTGDKPGGYALLDKAKGLLRSDSGRMRFAGIISMWMLKDDDAVALFQKTIQLNHRDSDAHAYLGVLYYRLSRGRRIVSSQPIQPGYLLLAETELKKSLKLNPVNSGAHFYLGNTYYKMGKKTEAIFEFEQAIKNDNGNWEARANLAQLYHVSTLNSY